MVGFLGRCLQAHIRFVGCAIALLVVAPYTRRSEILPRVATAARAGDDVIHRKWWMRRTAVVATHTIATKNVLSRELDLFERDAQVRRKANHRREWIPSADGAHSSIASLFNDLGLGEHQQQKCLLRCTHADRLV